MSTSQSPKRCLRFVGEFFVIVVGVFVAVAAESWWSEREDRDYELELRMDMVAEFEVNSSILESDLAVNDTARARIASFVDLREGELQAMSSAEVAEMIGRWLTWAGFDPEMGSAQALVESGDMGAIGDRELRLLLSRWAGLLDEKRRYNLQAVDFQMHQVAPAVARASDDNDWTERERREVQELLRGLGQLQDRVTANQLRLQSAAREILAYLRP